MSRCEQLVSDIEIEQIDRAKGREAANLKQKEIGEGVSIQRREHHSR